MDAAELQNLNPALILPYGQEKSVGTEFLGHLDIRLQVGIWRLVLASCLDISKGGLSELEGTIMYHAM